MLNVTFRNTTTDDDKMLYDVNLVLTQKVIGEDVELQMEPEDVRMRSQKAIEYVNVIVAIATMSSQAISRLLQRRAW